MSSSAPTLLIPALKNIVFATDFSPASEAVLPLLRTLASGCASTVHVVHVIAPEAKTAVPLDLVPELDAQHADADAAMQKLLSGEAFQQITHFSIVERGNVGEVLASVAQEKEAGLIVLGTHGRRGLRRLVLGSTAEQVIRTAPCPVLTVGPHTAANSQRGLGDAIVAAVDFSGGSHPALRYAASLARANRVKLILVHAVPPAVEVPQGNLESIPFNPMISAELIARAVETAKQQVDELVSTEQLQDFKPEIVVESGPPADLILRAAEENKAGLIVMGAHRAWMQSVATHLPWATVSAILCEAPCPVLTVRD